jgi:hypothetical protein
LRQELWPSGRFVAGILKRRFEHEGGKVRKWVVTGLPEVEEFVLKVGRAVSLTRVLSLTLPCDSANLCLVL